MKAILIAILLIAVSTPINAQKTEYHVNKKAKNLVKFISKAPVEDFDGVTKSIDGYLLHEGDAVSNGSSLYFEVDLRTLDTGIGLRNRHMREEYLHTDTYPYAKFMGDIIKATASGRKTDVEVRGVMDIHGKKKDMTVTGSISPTATGLRIQSKFEVKLPDHNIAVPKFMFLKISENMRLELDVHLIMK
jgi:polyisoprenoid-binding protein YceI